METISKEEASSRLKKFSQYGETHLYLACHAALPLAITPDLLYHLRDRFKQDTNGKVLDIPWVAVADLLLSDLCEIKDRDIELYKMHKEVRNLLLRDLQNNANLGSVRIKQLITFLLYYVKPHFYNSVSKIRSLAKSQWLWAMAYTQPREAENEITKALWRTYELQDLEELERIEWLLEDLAENLAEFEPLLASARRLNSLARGNLDEEDILLTERGVDYTRLQALLLARNWKEADLETKVVLLKATDREKEGWFNIKDIKQFPRKDIQTIDKLWLKYSRGSFGFSVQKRLWYKINGLQNIDYIAWCCFCDIVGWRVNLNWLLWEQLNFSAKAPEGHLPTLGWWSFVWRDSWQIWRDRWSELEAFLHLI